jgi:hypothetical protein
MKKDFVKKHIKAMRHHSKILFVLLGLYLLSIPSKAQQTYSVDLSLIDGIELNPDNIFNYRIDNRSNQSQQVEITGRLYYRRSALNFTYKYSTLLQPGINTISKNTIPSPSWTFSETALRELFLNYNKLPQGTYEYCVTVNPRKPGSEQPDPNEPSACTYQTVEDLFLINLITPENDAKIYEYNPMLAWVVNYPFASELSYKLRVAELKQGQNPQNAITRNNPMYKDDHVMTTGAIYPVAAKPLQKWQPYVWTVDAYYKGILLGGAEVWKFTIVDDSELVAVPRDQSYLNIKLEAARSELYAIGALKLKYILEDLNQDVLQLNLFDNSGKKIKLPEKELQAVYGDNRYILDFKEKIFLKHFQKYRLEIVSITGEKFVILFKYINPELIN